MALKFEIDEIISYINPWPTKVPIMSAAGGDLYGKFPVGKFKPGRDYYLDVSTGDIKELTNDKIKEFAAYSEMNPDPNL